MSFQLIHVRTHQDLMTIENSPDELGQSLTKLSASSFQRRFVGPFRRSCFSDPSNANMSIAFHQIEHRITLHRWVVDAAGLEVAVFRFEGVLF